MSATRIIIFAKAPVAGKVKTRLIPLLGAHSAAQLARVMLLRTILEADAADVGPVEICADPHPLDPDWQNLLPRAGFDLTCQGEGDLGERLARAAALGLRRTGAIVLIGTDCPSLHRHRLQDIVERLKEADSVIYPAADGGYVALGLRKFDRSLFTRISWSTASVAQQTIFRIEDLGWSLDIGETLRDVDVPDDLLSFDRVT